ncbi:MAG: hypothetical protein QM647_15250 [Asticcacaulis sp.]|uniref:hypothetical protein n=1 Tax=Asticcacaulis sp. TaxID=1872648 RepID=UPI0039E226DB
MNRIPDPKDLLNKDDDSSADAMAALEQSGWVRLDTLSGATHRNRIIIQKAVGGCLRLTVWIAFFALWAGGITLLWHMIGPERWRWLKPEEVAHLQSIIFSSALGAVVAKGAQHYIFGNDKGAR